MTTQPFAYKRGPSRRGRNAQPEADFQRAVVVYLTYALPPEYRFRAGMEGTKLSKYGAGKAKGLGMRRGWPDVEIKNRATGAVRWVELKAPGGSLTPEQREFIAECPKVCAVAHNLEELEAALIGWGIKPCYPLAQANRYGAGVG